MIIVISAVYLERSLGVRHPFFPKNRNRQLGTQKMHLFAQLVYMQCARSKYIYTCFVYAIALLSALSL